MHIIIDGYNLLRSQDSLTEKRFLQSLQQYASIKKHKISIIFDGGSIPWPLEEKIKYLSIIYAGGGNSADSYIMSKMKEGVFKSENTLFISSDRELISYVAEHNIICMGSYEFWPFVQKALLNQRQRRNNSLKSNQIIRKKENTTLTDFDRFMIKASQQQENSKKEIDQVNVSVYSDKKLSRLERSLLSIIKKL